MAVDSTLSNVVSDAQFPNYLLSELDRDADEEQIKLAYRRLAKFYHPDGMSLNIPGLIYFVTCWK